MIIAVCDDNDIALNNICSLIEKNLEKQCRILKFNTASALEFYIDDNKKFNLDILVIDIDLGNSNGIDLAKKVKSHFPLIKIIFITGFINYAENIFEADPTYFIVKPIKEDKLVDALNKTINAINEDKPDIISISSKGAITNINLKNLKYIESFKRQIIIHESTDEIKLYFKLKEIEKILPSHFVRCHQSYIVNMNKVKYLNTGSFSLYDGESIPISQSRYNKTKESFINYLGEKLCH